MFCVIARGTQNKPIIRHNCIPPRMANIGNQCWWSWGWTGICGHFVGIHVDQQLFGELWNTYLPSEMPVSFLHVYFRGLKKTIYQKFLMLRIYITALLSITPVWKWLGTPVSRRMGEPSLMQSHRGILLRNKRSFWNTMHRVPDSVTLSAVTEPCTVADCGLRRVGGSGLGRYEGLFLPWFSWALPLMLPLPERTSTLGRLSLSVTPESPVSFYLSELLCV